MSVEIKPEVIENLDGASIAMEMLMNMQNNGIIKKESDFDAMDDSHSDGSSGENGEHAGSPTGKKVTVTQWKGRLVPINEHTDKLCIIYDSRVSDRTYKFILHRKNNQKADNYACARCKSRKKYIRVLVSGEYFLEDPEALEHICYMTGKQLEIEKEKLQEKAGRAMVMAATKTPKATKRYRPSRTAALTTAPSTSHTGTPLGLLAGTNDDGAALLQLLQNSGALGLNQTLSPTESSSADASNLSTSNIMENLMKKCNEAEEANVSTRASQEKQIHTELKETKLDIRPRVHQVMPVISNTEASSQQITMDCSSVPTSLASLFELTAQAKPSVSSASKKSDPSPSEVFFMCLRRALDGIPDQSRPKAENEIMQFVYQTLYSKYVRNS